MPPGYSKCSDVCLIYIGRFVERKDERYIQSLNALYGVVCASGLRGCQKIL